MSQQLRTYTTLEEDPGWVLSTHIAWLTTPAPGNMLPRSDGLLKAPRFICADLTIQAYKTKK